MRTPQLCVVCKCITTNIIINQRYTRKDGLENVRWMCNPCNSTRVKNYYHKNSDTVRQTIYKSIRKHKAKQTARETMNNALKLGTLSRPTNCEDCGKECKPHGHHEDYTKPLEVNWVCTTCHGERHQEHRSFVGEVVTAC